MNVFLIFIVTFCISFAGSVQIGPLNAAVIQATLLQNRRTALWIAIGGCIPEIIYGWIALYSVHFLEQHPLVFYNLRIAATIILLILGLFLVFKTQQERTFSSALSTQFSIFKGFVLSILNPQLLPFWVTILIAYKGFEWLSISSLGHKISFLLGASLGAFVIHLLFIVWTDKYRKKLNEWIDPNKINRILGCLFILIAFWQIFSLLSDR
jgi:threonine/homoserine/homoserine lactone efflux protein